MAKIKVLHSSDLWLAQTQTWIYSQVVNSTNNEIESYIVCEKATNLEQFQVDNIHSREKSSFLKQLKMRLYERLILFRRSAYTLITGREVKPQIIHSHFGDRGWIDLPAIKKLGCKQIVTFYGYDVTQLPQLQPIWKERYKELFLYADAFLCEGIFMAKSLTQLGCNPNKVFVQHLGVDTDHINYKPREWVKEEPLRILIAAGFREKKGIPYALQAIAGIKDRVTVEVTIIGDAVDKPDSIKEKEQILSTLETLKLNKQTKLLGFQPHHIMLDEAYKHHIFLSPSVTAKDGDSEGGAPVSIIEMIATGMIVVSTSHCDIPEVVKYPIKDWLVNERDVDSLTLRLQWLIDNPNQWDDLQSSGRRHIEEEYNSVNQGEKLSKFYESLVKNKNG